LYLNNCIGYHAVTWHSVKFDIVWLKLVLTWFHFRFITKSIKNNLFHFNVIKQLQSFVSVNTSFLWILEINIHLSLKASVNIVFKVNKNSYWPQQKTIIIGYYTVLCTIWKDIVPVSIVLKTRIGRDAAGRRLVQYGFSIQYGRVQYISILYITLYNDLFIIQLKWSIL
jgi:hypothetical protein